MSESAYDVFKGLPDKKPLWLGAVPGLERAINQMNRMAGRLPGNYFVFDPRTHEVVATVIQNFAAPISSGPLPRLEGKVNWISAASAYKGNLMTVPIDPPAWKQIFQSVLDERDAAKMGKKVHLAEEAIFFRLQALQGCDDHYEERSEMARACEELLRLKTERLGWPPIEAPETKHE